MADENHLDTFLRHTCALMPWPAKKLKAMYHVVFIMNTFYLHSLFPGTVLLFSSGLALVSNDRDSYRCNSHCISHFLTTRGSKNHLDNLCHYVMRKWPNFGLTGKVSWDNCCTYAAEEVNIGIVEPEEGMQWCLSCSGTYFLEWHTSTAWHKECTPNEVLCHIRCWVSGPPVDLVHDVHIPVGLSLFRCLSPWKNSWCELLLYGPDCTILCILVRTRNTQ